jgi:hypothetical protein
MQMSAVVLPGLLCAAAGLAQTASAMPPGVPAKVCSSAGKVFYRVFGHITRPL